MYRVIVLDLKNVTKMILSKLLLCIKTYLRNDNSIQRKNEFEINTIVKQKSLLSRFCASGVKPSLLPESSPVTINSTEAVSFQSLEEFRRISHFKSENFMQPSS